MKKIKAILVDDEANGRSNLHNLLTEFCPQVDVVAEAANVKEAIEAIDKNPPQVVFLDIEMPGGSGFDLLKHYPKLEFEVIFTTAYSEYATRAFRFSAIDYLLKPIDVLELQTSIQKAEAKKLKSSSRDQLELLKENLNAAKPKRIALPDLKGYVFVKPEEILYCEADGNFTHFTLLGSKKIMVCRPIKEYDNLLSDQGFFRIHASSLVNLDFVQKYFRGKGGIVQMTDGKELDVSQRRKKEFLALIAGR